MAYDVVRSMILLAIYWCLMKVLNVSLSIHLECFEMEKMCFSFLMVYFVNIDVFAFVGFLLATFV